MSYILDALRRADAERERGRVPGLHSQVSPGGAAPRTSAPRRGRTRPKAWAFGAGALLLLGAAWLAYQNSRPDAASPSLGASLGASGPVMQADTTTNPAPNTAPAPSADPAPPAASTVAQAPEPIRPILAPAPPVPKPVAQAAPTPAPTPAPAPAAVATPSPTPSPSVSAAADANVIRLADLSPEARAQIPPLQVSGSTYSDNPALRMLIVNGKVVQEGQDIAPGLKLESIGVRTAIVNHRGQRLRISH